MTSLRRASLLLVLVAACGGTGVVSQALTSDDDAGSSPTVTAPTSSVTPRIDAGVPAARADASAPDDAEDAGIDAGEQPSFDAGPDAGHDAGFCGFDYAPGFTEQRVPAHMGLHVRGGVCVHGSPDCATRTLCGCFNQINTGDISSTGLWTSNPYEGADFERTPFDPNVEIPGCN